ncbi:DUF2564 family protein [Alkalihalobacillus hemicellulosilyticus]|uniref:Cytosolic protein n=1 Tax=Halalkalibacter hemicellulosilyticusJCM 9152 TaxID=1236971 RepID=W4QEP9_9BACI|nr:DUF2564 family protein [Halalkalibacter hemicellulosilyticus]GAE30531.1 hypothetical protein JCM9152_1939 [Halalkalibacter hemicellulosilyticusJCM 9152]
MASDQDYNDIKQVEMAILSAEHMVGQATRSMDEEQLQSATEAISIAKTQLRNAVAHQTGVDHTFLEMADELINKADHQLIEAMKDRQSE